MYYAKQLARLVGELEKLPGIGPKSAQRLAFHLLRVPPEEARLLADAIIKVKEQIHSCSVCYNFTDQETCEICSSARRDRSILCVVEYPRDHEINKVLHRLRLVVEAWRRWKNHRSRARQPQHVLQMNRAEWRFSRHEHQRPTLLEHHVRRTLDQ